MRSPAPQREPAPGRVGGPTALPFQRGLATGPPDLHLLSPCPGPQVYRQALLEQYRKDLQEWEDESVRQEAEFTITDRTVKVRRAQWALNTTHLSDWPY